MLWPYAMLWQHVRRSILCGALLALAGGNATLPAQEPPGVRPYDGLQAGLDAYYLAEEQRRANLAQQLFLNDQLRMANGLPPGGRWGDTTWLPPPVSREFAYGYGMTRPFGAVENVYGPPTVFEPWPLVPGDVYGYPVVPTPAGSMSEAGGRRPEVGGRRPEDRSRKSKVAASDPELIPPPPAPRPGPREY